MRMLQWLYQFIEQRPANMQYINHENTKRFKNSDSCTAIEYDFRDSNDINIAAIELHGRYPEAGYALNTISKEVVYVKSGEGTLNTPTDRTSLSIGDAALIEPNERYYFEGTLELVISSSPAWSPEQHRNIIGR